MNINVNHLSFLQLYDLKQEIGKSPPYSLREAHRKRDKGKVKVKVLLKINHLSDELDTLLNEIKFWKRLSHPSIIQLTEYYDEEGFIYVVYENTKGSDLSSLISNKIQIFAEGFAKKIVLKLLNGLDFLHSNGIVHGACIPQNIIFIEDKNTPGWVNTVKLGFFMQSAGNTPPTIYSDLRDLAYSICALMKRRGYILKETFDPVNIFELKSSSSSDLGHLSENFYDFIDQLWNAESYYITSENLLNHPWLKESSWSIDQSTGPMNPPNVNLSTLLNKSEASSSWLKYKLPYCSFLNRLLLLSLLLLL